jgi:tartrate dehydrogenase/decarboxylase/D-malate dehydrogenase
MFPGTDREFVVQDTIMTRTGVDRVLKYAFELAQKRPRKKLTSATKSNGISISMPYWDERVVEMSKNYPEVAVDKYHIDILTAFFVLRPEAFDVVVGSVSLSCALSLPRLTIRISLVISCRISDQLVPDQSE